MKELRDIGIFGMFKYGTYCGQCNREMIKNLYEKNMIIFIKFI